MPAAKGPSTHGVEMATKGRTEFRLSIHRAGNKGRASFNREQHGCREAAFDLTLLTCAGANTASAQVKAHVAGCPDAHNLYRSTRILTPRPAFILPGRPAAASAFSLKNAEYFSMIAPSSTPLASACRPDLSWRGLPNTIPPPGWGSTQDSGTMPQKSPRTAYSDTTHCERQISDSGAGAGQDDGKPGLPLRLRFELRHVGGRTSLPRITGLLAPVTWGRVDG